MDRIREFLKFQGKPLLSSLGRPLLAFFMTLLLSFFAFSQSFSRAPRLTEEKLIQLVDSSKTYGEYISRLTKLYPPDAHVLFWSSDRGVKVTTSKTPQYFIIVDGVTIAIAPDRFSEATFNHGEQAVVIHVVSDETGKPVMNQFRFTLTGVLKNNIEHHITSELLKEQGVNGLARKSKSYEILSCTGCHLAERRRLFEADNHTRVFEMDKNWVFKDRTVRAVIESELKQKLKEFDTPENRRSSNYAWVFQQPQVLKRGYLTAGDMITYGRAYREMALDTAEQILGDLRADAKWPRFKRAFEYAVTGNPRFDEEIARVTGRTPQEIQKERERVEKLQAQRTWSHINIRNAQAIAYITSNGDPTLFSKNVYRELANPSLLVNLHSIEAIGPEILNMLVSDEEWSSLPSRLQAKSIRKNELVLKNLRELKKFVTNPVLMEKIRRRANAHIVFKSIFGNDTEALARMSLSIGATAESFGRGSDLIENYARALARNPDDDPLFSLNTSPDSTLLVEKDLELLYRENPGLRTDTSDLTTFEEEARRIIGDEGRVRALMDFVKGDLDRFQEARSDIIYKLVRSEPPLGRIVVSGQSVTGMVAAAVMAQTGFQVDVFDIRDSFTRNVQWANRQAMADELASIDPDLAKRFILKVTDLLGGYVVVKPDGSREGADHRLAGTDPDPRRIPRTGWDVLSQKPGGVVELKVFENLLREFVSNHPNIRRVSGLKIDGYNPATEKYHVTLTDRLPNARPEIESFEPDLVIIAEGANSATRRDILKINTVKSSPERLNVAGVLEIPGRSGLLVRRYRRGASGKMVSITMGAEDSPGVWMITDLDPVQAPKSQPAEREREVLQQFKQVAAGNLGLPLSALDKVHVMGAFGDHPLQTFDLQQKFSSRAYAGINVMLLADAVGNKHWSAGGGGAIGAISHVERLKTYLVNKFRGKDPRQNIREYSKGVLMDTHAWGEVSLFDFYDNMTKEEGKRAYDLAVKAYYDGKVKEPLDALNVMFPEGRAARNISEHINAFPQRLEEYLRSKPKESDGRNGLDRRGGSDSQGDGFKSANCLHLLAG